jgi:hypothetical protein
MDIINKLHSCFREVQGFEFGDDFVKIFDVKTGKYWKIVIEEYKPTPKDPEKTILKAQESTIVKKATKDTRKTWASILKERK